MTSPDYSPFARQYAQCRPTYPAELFSYLATLGDRRRLAWDCATGNGQAALGLVKHFERVIATDVSAEQIRQAPTHPQIEYRIGRAEQSGLDNQSVDLVTVASAIHWFDFDRFYEEVSRVVRPGGLLAAWAYHVGYVEPPFDKILERFYWDVVSPYFAAGAKFVDERYENIRLPGEPIQASTFFVSASWNLDQMLAFIASWSGTQQYVLERGDDPVALIAEDLEDFWGERDRAHTVRWPLYIRISRQ
jgi:SAM-dependent methyltransferase